MSGVHVATVDVVLVNLEKRTAFCSDGITRTIYQMYDSDARLTEDTDQAVAAVVRIEDGKFILLDLSGGAVTLH